MGVRVASAVWVMTGAVTTVVVADDDLEGGEVGLILTEGGREEGTHEIDSNISSNR